MEAAHITWRPLGQLFVERGLITQDELEEALVEQEETRKRLGAILVSRGLVSGPELTSVLVDQLGMELTKESGFGSGLWDEIRRRHSRADNRQDGAAQQAEADVEAEPAPEPPAQIAAVAPPEPEPDPEPAAEPEPAVPDTALLEEALAALTAERAVLEQALEEERAARKQALAELTEARAGTSSRVSELADLARQVTDLRRQVEESTAAVAAEKQAVGLVEELERSLVAEKARRQEHAAELDFARGEARAEARELRASLDRIRAELEQLDAATSWFEYWSGAVDPTAKD